VNCVCGVKNRVSYLSHLYDIGVVVACVFHCQCSVFFALFSVFTNHNSLKECNLDKFHFHHVTV
jgi:hypothetical protein